MTNQNSAKKFFEFARSHKELYLYGAGSRGKRYYELLLDRGIDIRAFIVTDRKDTGMLLGHEIVCIEDIKDSVSDRAGIIPAFTGFDPNEISEMFPGSKPDILTFDHTYLEILSEERNLKPVLNNMRVGVESACLKFETEKWRKVLIIRIDEIGDLVITTPFIKNLKRFCPKAEITVAARPYNMSLLKNCPYVKRIAVYDAPKRGGDISDQCEIFSNTKRNVDEFIRIQLGNGQFDAVFIGSDLLSGNNVLDSYYMAMKSGARCRFAWILNTGADREKVCEWTQRDFSSLTVINTAQHEVKNVLSMFSSLGYNAVDEEMELWPDDNAYEVVMQLSEGRIKKDKVNIVLGITASSPVRTWGEDNYVSLIDNMEFHYPSGYRFVLVGGNDSESIGNMIEQSSEGDVVNLAGKTELDETAACIGLCDIYFGSNTGTLHMASAMKKPSVTLYAALPDRKATDGDSPERMGAYGTEYLNLIPDHGLDGCNRVCRMGRSHCIRQITPEMAESAICRIVHKIGIEDQLMKNVIVYGTGKYFHSHKYRLPDNMRIVGYADSAVSNSSRCTGKLYEGLMIYHPSELYKVSYDFVYICTDTFTAGDIVIKLRKYGISDDKIRYLYRHDYISGWWNSYPNEGGVLHTIKVGRRKIKLYEIEGTDFNTINETFFEGQYAVDIQPDSIVIDIGMNIGDSSLYFAASENVRKVYGFEPFQDTFEHALKNFGMNTDNIRDKVKPFNVALSNKDDNYSVSMQEKNSGWRTIGQKEKETCQERKPTVDLIIRDSVPEIQEIVKENKESKIIIKCDTEGSEFDIFPALDKAGVLKNIDAVTMEYHAEPSLLLDILRQNGFICIRNGRSFIGIIYAVRGI